MFFTNVFFMFFIIGYKTFFNVFYSHIDVFFTTMIYINLDLNTLMLEASTVR